MISIAKDLAAPEVLRIRGKALRKALCKQFSVAYPDFMTKKISFNRDVYAHRDVKTVLLRCQHNKCAYCESIVRRHPGCVEHFRPKSGFQQMKSEKIAKPGYYWLAYEWDNLLFACHDCNNHKGTSFPLANPKKRAKDHGYKIGRESPLLIDPSKEDPALFIRFRDEIAHPIDNSIRAKSTIEILGLNQLKLVEDRLAVLNNIKQSINVIDQFELDLQRGDDSRKSKLLREYKELLAYRGRSESEYASMARSFLDLTR